jgi:MFS family permease
VADIPRDDAPATGLPIASVLVPFALIFALCNYFRAVNAVLAPHLIAEFSLTAGQLGFLISIYFFVSAVFQTPLGLLMDRYGPRRVQAVLIVMAGTGAIIYALGTSWPVLLTGRVIMGIGAAGGLMTAIQAVTLWFPSARWPSFNGMVMSIGTLGSLLATLPTQYLLDFITWHQVIIGSAGAAFIGSLVLWTLVPEKTKAPKNETLGEQLRGMGVIYRDRLFWRFAPLYLATTGSTLAFQSLWAGPWLQDVVKLDATTLATHLLIMSASQIVAYFLIGFVSTALDKRHVPLSLIIICGSGCYILSLTPLLWPNGAGQWSVLLGIGMLSNFNMLCYPIISKHFPPAMIGRATTALNSFFFVGAFGVQLSIGLVISFVAGSSSQNHYPVIAYQLAFAVMIALQLAAWAWCLVKPRDRVAQS